MLLQENETYNEAYREYELPYQSISSRSVGVLDAPTEQDAYQPPNYPPGPVYSPPTPPRKRRGRGGAILLLTIVLALIFSVGLFSGWEFAHNGNSSSSASA